jgi:hypothetical protein
MTGELVANTTSRTANRARTRVSRPPTTLLWPKLLAHKAHKSFSLRWWRGLEGRTGVESGRSTIPILDYPVEVEMHWASVSIDLVL